MEEPSEIVLCAKGVDFRESYTEDIIMDFRSWFVTSTSSTERIVALRDHVGTGRSTDNVYKSLDPDNKNLSIRMQFICLQ